VAPLEQKHCFLLTAHAQDVGNHFEIELFGKSSEGAVFCAIITTFRPCFFVSSLVSASDTSAADERRPLPLKSLSGQQVDCCYFNTYARMRECAENLRQKLLPVYETDVYPLDRFLMERSVFGGFEARGILSPQGNTVFMQNPQIRGTDVSVPLSIMSIDIETHVADGTIYSVACAGVSNRVFIIGTHPSDETNVFCQDETSMLVAFLRHLQTEDPDVIIGWNVIDFDLRILFDRCRSLGVPFTAGRGNRKSDSVYQVRGGNRTIARIAGRVIIDVPVLLRTYYHAFEEYSLNFVASELLGKEKEITLTGKEKIAQIDYQFNHDKYALASYNLQDTLLTREIFDTTECLPNAIERTKRSGQLLDRVGGSIAAFDYLYLPRLHRAGYVAPDVYDASLTDTPLPGGYVIEPQAGLYSNVLVFDFRSLYPSIIMTFAIDPLGIHCSGQKSIKGPCGPAFSIETSILPGIIGELLAARMEAKRSGNTPLSQAIKILMNSFYGVLGARNCRFFSAEIATAITKTGQYLLKKTIGYIEKTFSYPVIYGDTDSLFVQLGAGREGDAEAVGKEIARATTEWLAAELKEQFMADSALLLQFEAHYQHFLIPSVRGAVQGSKKHYCGGSVTDGELSLHFKGMESARSDWTDLAKLLQQELIKRVFTKEPLDDYLIETVSALKKGLLDDKLVYKKRLRKKVDEYTLSIPLHVQAAKLLDNPPHMIRYYITIDGPQPVEKLTSAIDYVHYLECQLQPVADSVLELIGTSFDKITSGQQDLFG